MPVKCHDKPVLLPDPDGELAKFLDRYLSINGKRFFAPPIEQDDLRILSVREGDSTPMVLTMAKANWPKSPRPRINTLYWPTGASRFAHCLLLVDGDTKDEIVSGADLDGPITIAGSVQLTISDEGFVKGEGDLEDGFSVDESGKQVLNVPMWLLEPHPVSLPGSSDKTLWLLPLVDERYFWQWIDIGNAGIPEDADWEGVLNYFSELLVSGGASSISELPVEFQWVPEFVENGLLHFANAAVMLDAAAMSVGMRVVKSLNGELHMLSVEDAEGNWDSSTSDSRDTLYSRWSRIAGGEPAMRSGAAGRPEAVEVVWPDGTSERVDQDDADVSLGGVGLTAKRFRVPYLPEDYTEGQRSALALRIAKGVFGWMGRFGDQTFAGLKPWQISGFEDYVEYEFGSFGRSGQEYHFQTRVASMPDNFGITTMLAGSNAGVSSGGGGGSSATGCGGCGPWAALGLAYVEGVGQVSLRIQIENNLEGEEPAFILAELDTETLEYHAIDVEGEPISYDSDCPEV